MPLSSVIGRRDTMVHVLCLSAVRDSVYLGRSLTTTGPLVSLGVLRVVVDSAATTETGQLYGSAACLYNPLYQREHGNIRL